MTEAKTSVLLITRNLPPLLGGMERLNWHLALALHSGYELAVAGPHGCARHLPPLPGRISETRHRPLSVFLLGCALGALRLARCFRPSFVVAGSGLTAPFAWLTARITGARSVVYLHGLDVVVDNPVYRRLWIPLIRRMQLVLVNSRNTARLAESCGIPTQRIRLLHPGTELPGRDDGAGKAFRERHAVGERPLLLSVGRLTPRKGLAEFVEHGLPDVLAEFPDALLMIIGDDARDALRKHRGPELERIKRCASAAGVERAIRFLPRCDDETLSDAYDASDVHVFPVRPYPGDVEGFGMVAIEAAAHGLPTVAFDTGGVSDAVVHGKTGDLIAPDDHAAFARVVKKHLDRRGDPAVRNECFRAVREFGWDRFGEQLRSLLREFPFDRTR